mmetsp:Transcript_103535/g.288283  ORF Transcript_103535/g.288283 Transcript_103535/m.288283 type:complete len:204 (-) Transcript_103535:428-1039(-)
MGQQFLLRVRRGPQLAHVGQQPLLLRRGDHRGLLRQLPQASLDLLRGHAHAAHPDLPVRPADDVDLAALPLPDVARAVEHAFPEWVGNESLVVFRGCCPGKVTVCTCPRNAAEENLSSLSGFHPLEGLSLQDVQPAVLLGSADRYCLEGLGPNVARGRPPCDYARLRCAIAVVELCCWGQTWTLQEAFQGVGGRLLSNGNNVL